MRGPFEITWHDAYCPEDAWYQEGEYEPEPRVMVTVGWVLYQGNGYLSVAATYDEEGGHYAQIINIPLSCIQRPWRDVSELVRPDDAGASDGGDPSDDPADREQP